MTMIRDYFNSFKNADFVDQIKEIPLQYGYINSLNLFGTRSTASRSIIFDKSETNITLLPQVSRGTHQATEGKDDGAKTFALPLAYFKRRHRLTADDVNDWRRVGATDSETLANATAEKLQAMRMQWDQTLEYMKLQAMKGVFKTPDGKVMADMFTEFGITQTEIDFDLGDNSTNIDEKIRLLKKAVSTSVKNGGAISGVKVLVDPEFYDKLIAHPNFRSVYINYANSGKQMLTDSMTSYMQWGIMDEVTHRGVSFVSYDATFNLPDGSTEVAFAASTGLAVAQGPRDLFRGYFGPSNKLSQANQPGQELFMNTYLDDRDEWVDFEMESAPLFFCTKPASLIKVKSTT